MSTPLMTLEVNPRTRSSDPNKMDATSPTPSIQSNDPRIDTSAWVKKHGEDSVIQAIQSSDYPMFNQLLDNGHDVEENDYIYSRSGICPTLPIHVAAAHPNPIFLRSLLDGGADPNDYSQLNYPHFNNTFQSAVRAAQWDNVFTIIQAGGVQGGVDPDDFWEDRNHFINPSHDDVNVQEGVGLFFQAIFSLPWAQLAHITLPQVEILRRQTGMFCFDSLNCQEDEHSKETTPLTNLDWLIDVEVPHLDNSRRIEIVNQLIRGGAEVACYTFPSYTDMWDLRAKALETHPPCPGDYLSPLVGDPYHLGVSYHTSSTPLHACVSANNGQLLRYLVSEANFNADIPEFTTRAASPLLLSIRESNLALSQVLVDLGAHIDFITPIMRLTAVHFAASTHDLPLLRWVIETIENSCEESAAHDIFKQKSLLGHTALHIACLGTLTDPSEAVELSIHYTLPHHRTGPFHSPTQEFLDLLRRTGAGEWSDRDHQGNTPAHYLAASHSYESGVEFDKVFGSAKSIAKDARNAFDHTIDDLL